ncbi:MAG: site-specific integrase [Acidobacteria bacterium]|nr:site-specific integrase [Acidobacteriota bacterium]
MGFSRKRIGRGGKARYTAYYIDLKGRERSAGTFSNKKEADKKWQHAETKLAEGRVGDPARGRMLFERYVEDTWLPNHVMEPSTREGYTYSIYKHIMPEFGPMRMVDILPEHVRAWVAQLATDGVTPATIRHLKTTLSVIFTTAFNDQVIFLHPCKGVKTPPVPRKSLTIITPEQFDLIYEALPDADTKLLVETNIESGLRWGELTELRARDIDFQTCILTISRAVVEVNPKFHPEGKRFWVKEYPKDKEPRRFKLSAQIVEKLKAHRDAERLGPNDLLFTIRSQENRKPKLRVAPNPDELGLTPPNDNGRQYKHGTLSGYGAGKCRCANCKAACAIYRAKRRIEGKDNPRKPRTLDTDGHIPNWWFRNNVWNPAVKKARLQKGVRVHDLRHAHASWLLAGGADLQVVKERLGHGSIATTERYLHTLPEADETALDALFAIRHRPIRKTRQ